MQDDGGRRINKWGIYKATRALSSGSHEFSKPSSPYCSTTNQVVGILRLWEEKWASEPSMQSLLNKKTFLHEAEESIVALHFLGVWRSSAADLPGKFVAMDVCGGKGFFSLLLQYVNAMFWAKDDDERAGKPQLDRIILLEKATENTIDWQHLSKPPADPALSASLVQVDLWQDCNLKELETVTNRIRDINSPLALTGIHLCKMLSPSLVSIVNQLGPQIRYLCLAPCCMPRVVTGKHLPQERRKLDILQWEDKTERALRVEHNRRYGLAARKTRFCYLCSAEDHWLRDCPLRPIGDDQVAQDKAKDFAKSNTPCWNCGVPGHIRDECPTHSERIQRRCPPFRSVDVSRVLESPEPVLFYARLLASNLGEAYKTTVVDCPLIGATTRAADARNWNAERKSIFMVAHRSADHI